jgi:hypothetical protein
MIYFMLRISWNKKMRYRALNNNYANVPSVVSRETRMMQKLSGTQQFLVHADDCNLVGESIGFGKRKQRRGFSSCGI